MQSPFTFNNNQLSLSRFPVDKNNPTLQAWDAADEYLINYLYENNLLNKNITALIFNDSFGALALSCAQQQVFSVNDSYVSQQGLQHNLQVNEQQIALTTSSLTLLNSLDELPKDIDIILYKIPKSKSLLIEQLAKISVHYNDNTLFIAGARAKDIHSSTLRLFEKHLGTTTTSLAVKKARLVFSNINNKTLTESLFPTTWPLENTNFVITNHANVFAREQLDLGARFFLQHLPLLKSNDHVIDLGCGNGVIGLSLLAKQKFSIQSSIQLDFIDESYMAVASAKVNIEQNLPTLKMQCNFIWTDCLTDVDANSTDLILCNPPFHQQHAVTDHIAWQMFTGSHRVLKKGGELRIIGNRQLGYHTKLTKIFSKVEIIASNKKFVIIKAFK
ncbi:MAG: methyltransferase [Alteromonadaceae bacterium]|nr:methyltransferase [Alteromonadaceae bacterium]